jgi:hypothetical protein
MTEKTEKENSTKYFRVTWRQKLNLVPRHWLANFITYIEMHIPPIGKQKNKRLELILYNI